MWYMPKDSIAGDCTGVDDTDSVVLQLKDVKLTPVDDSNAPPRDPHAGVSTIDGECCSLQSFEVNPQPLRLVP